MHLRHSLLRPSYRRVLAANNGDSQSDVLDCIVISNVSRFPWCVSFMSEVQMLHYYSTTIRLILDASVSVISSECVRYILLALQEDDKLSEDNASIWRNLYADYEILQSSPGTQEEVPSALIYWGPVPTLPVLLDRSSEVKLIHKILGGWRLGVALRIGYIFYGPINGCPPSKLQRRRRRRGWWLWRKIWMVYYSLVFRRKILVFIVRGNNGLNWHPSLVFVLSYRV